MEFTDAFLRQYVAPLIVNGGRTPFDLLQSVSHVQSSQTFWAALGSDDQGEITPARFPTLSRDAVAAARALVRS